MNRIVLPSHENSKAGNDSVRKYAEHFRNMINNKIRILKDDEVTESDLENSDFIAFGTVNGNSFIQRHINEMPIIINEDYVVFKDIIYGSDFRITTTWLNPFNKKKQMIFFTGQKANEIRDYQYTRYKNENNYWIGRNNVTILKGNFERWMKIWTAN